MGITKKADFNTQGMSLTIRIQRDGKFLILVWGHFFIDILTFDAKRKYFLLYKILAAHMDEDLSWTVFYYGTARL